MAVFPTRQEYLATLAYSFMISPTLRIIADRLILGNLLYLTLSNPCIKIKVSST